ncbi:MAG: condensation domain-containing protein [Eubacteriales bacterium]
MPKTDKNTVFYDLTLSQFVVHYALTYSIYKQAMNIAVCVYIKNDLDFDLLKKAVRTEIGRNDSMRLYFKKKGGKIKQYFIDSEEAEKLPLNIVTADFRGKTKEEQHAYLMRDAAVPVHYRKGEIYRFKFLKTVDGGNAIYFVVCHLNMDAAAVFLTLRDLFVIYRAMEGNAEMPKPFNLFKDCILRELEYYKDGSVYEKNKKYYQDLYKNGGEPIYCSPSGFKALEDLRKKRRKPNMRSYPLFNPFQDRSKNISFHLNPEFSKQIDDFCSDESISPQSIFLLAVCTYLSKINNNAGEIFYNVVCPRRATLAEKNTFGCMASSGSTRTTINDKTDFREMLSQISADMAQTFRFTHYSAINASFELHKMYKISAFDHYTSFLMSYLGFLPFEGWECDAEWISNGRFAMGLYCVVMHSPVDGGYKIFYEYRTKMMNADHIKALHSGVTEIVRSGIENPSVEISEIKRLIPQFINTDEVKHAENR